MKEYKKSDVMENLKAACEAGMNKARLVARHGLAADTPARILQGEWLHPEYVDLNEAWKEFWSKRKTFCWVLKRYYEERGREVPEQMKVLFSAFVERLESAFNEVNLQDAFREVVDLADLAVTDDEQLEFGF